MYLNVVYSVLGVLLHNAVAVIVRVEQGRLRGEQLKTITGDTLYYSFKGIPYAAPPVGKLRFKAPQPAPSWGGVRNATEHGSVCPQFDQLRNQFEPGSEDCLFMNVYTPSVEPRSALPVIFVIHGGGFTWGSGNDDVYGPDFLIDTNIVVVTINYRLNHLGFLSMGTPEVPGNAGMKDQVAALRWVQRNIKHFGGDSNKVTISGESAGGISVTYHMLSPMSQGLFHRAIAMSGVATTSYTVEFEPERRAFLLGEILGFETTNTTALLELLQSVSAEQLVNVKTPIIAAEDYYIDVLLATTVPIIEKDFGQERFIIEPPEVSVKKGRSNVDIILGHTSAEGIFFLPAFDNNPVIENHAKYPEVLTPRDLYYRSTPKTHLKIADYVKEYYTGSKQMSLKTIPQFVSLMTDGLVYSIIKYTDLLSEYSRNNNIYLYEFSINSERNVYSKKGLKYGITGVSHFDDMMYLFNGKLYNLPLNKNATSYKMIRQTCALFSNFVKNGNPTPDSSSLGVSWPPYNMDSQIFLDIGEQLTLYGNPLQTMMNFYDFIYKAGSKNLV